MAQQPPPVMAQPPPPPAPIFALTPAALHTAAFVDLGTPEGRKMFAFATKPLDDLFDGAKTGLHMFIHQVTTRATICGWTNTILTMPTIADPTVQLSLLTQHGQITLEDIATHATTYNAALVKARQDALHMKIFLDGSLGKNLMMRVLAQKDKYTFAGVQHGPAMFRVIVQIVGIETNATVAVINATLRTLPTKMTEFKSDITKFNEFVTDQCNELIVRGKEPYDILHLLFEAYATANNEAFKEYIRSKENAVYDGTLTIDHQELMNTAEEKYKIMLVRGDWKVAQNSAATLTTDQHIVALQAQINELTAGNPTPKKATKNADGAAKANTGKWAWKDTAPKGTESKIKTFEGRSYCHCPNHKSAKWVLSDKHKDGCTLDPTWKFPKEGTDIESTAKPSPVHANMHVIEDGYISEDENA